MPRPREPQWRRGRRPPKAQIEFTETECFFVIDGVRVARRGKRAKTWVTLVPGWHIWQSDDYDDYGEITVEFRPEEAHPTRRGH
jgi:hypothetical protein